MIQYSFIEKTYQCNKSLYIREYSFTQSNCHKSPFGIRFFHFKPSKQLKKLYQMLYITPNSDRHTQTSVNFKANYLTLLQLFTKNHAFFYIPELKFTYVYLFNKLLTISYPKAEVVYFSHSQEQQFIPLLLLNISGLFHHQAILPVDGTTFSISFDI